ncbi:MAG: hypothetical protein ACQESC_00085, partial [Nanobdellota archaeon]
NNSSRNNTANSSSSQRKTSAPKSRSSARDEKEKRQPKRESTISDEEKTKFNTMLEDLIGTRGAYILDKELSVLGKIPISELESTIKSLNDSVYAVIFDGGVTKELLLTSEKSNVAYLVGMSAKVKSGSKTKIFTPEQLA